MYDCGVHICMYSCYSETSYFVAAVFAYQGLFSMDQYSFPEEIYDSNKLIVMTSEAPPPIPQKKKRRNTTGSVCNLMLRWEGLSARGIRSLGNLRKLSTL